MSGIKSFDDSTLDKLLGAEDAENERLERFKQYFLYNQAFENVRSDLPIRVIVGHKGVGKSALLRRCYLEDVDSGTLAVWLRSHELLGSAADQNINVLIEKWKNALNSIIVETAIKECFDDIGISVDKPSSGSSVVDVLIGAIRDKVKNLGRLKNAKKACVNYFLDNEIINVYIDDIDRGWSASIGDIRNISALLNAIRDMAGADPRLRFRVGLRSDVYYLVRTSDESTDKIERNIVWLQWTNHEILCLLAKRIETFFAGHSDQGHILRLDQKQISDNILSKIIVTKFNGRGHWSDRPIHNVLLSLTRARPRDLIKLMHGAGRNAHRRKATIISSDDLEGAFQSYSEERLQDVVNEFKSELPEIERLLLSLRPSRKTRQASDNYLFKTDRLITRLKESMDQNRFTFKNGKPVTPKSLLQFLYKIDFITARIEKDGQIERRFFDRARFLAVRVT